MVLFDIEIKKPKTFEIGALIRSIVDDYIFQYICCCGPMPGSHREYITAFGERCGPERIFDKNGQIVEDIWNSGDYRTVRRFYSNGALKSVKHYYRGKLHGRSIIYASDERVSCCETLYNNGHLVKSIV